MLDIFLVVALSVLIFVSPAHRLGLIDLKCWICDKLARLITGNGTS